MICLNHLALIPSAMTISVASFCRVNTQNLCYLLLYATFDDRCIFIICEYFKKMNVYNMDTATIFLKNQIFFFIFGDYFLLSEHGNINRDGAIASHVIRVKRGLLETRMIGR